MTPAWVETYSLLNSEIAELSKQIAAVGQHAENQSTTPAKGFAQNAKAMAQSATDAAKKKMLTVKFDQAVTRLGKSAFEQRSQLTLPQQQVDAITELHQQVSSLDEDIQLTTVPKPAWSMLDNRIIHSVPAICCFPIGLFLIGKSGLWSTRAKWIWTGAILFLFIGGILAPKEERQVLQPPLTKVRRETLGRIKAPANSPPVVLESRIRLKRELSVASSRSISTQALPVRWT